MFSVYVFNENDKLIIIEIFELSFVPVTFFAPKSLTVDATGPFFHTLQKSLSENKCENLFFSSFFSFIAFFEQRNQLNQTEQWGKNIIIAHF